MSNANNDLSVLKSDYESVDIDALLKPLSSENIPSLASLPLQTRCSSRLSWLPVKSCAVLNSAGSQLDRTMAFLRLFTVDLPRVAVRVRATA